MVLQPYGYSLYGSLRGSEGDVLEGARRQKNFFPLSLLLSEEGGRFYGFVNGGHGWKREFRGLREMLR